MAKKTKKQKLEVIFPKYETIHYGNGERFQEEAQPPLTEEQVKNILGWTEVEEGDFDFKDIEGRKIRCENNRHNRPFDRNWALALATDLLHSGDRVKPVLRRWLFNGENFIIGEYGSVLSGQHRGIAFVFACQLWEGEDHQHWKKFWKEKPTLTTSVFYGAEETPELIKTLDNVKPRTFADVIYTNDYFQSYGPKEREKLAKALDHAVRFLYVRTGACDSAHAYSTKRTHAEGLDFLRRHGKLLDCVTHAFEEREGLEKFRMPLGTFAGIMYLASVSSTDPDAYKLAKESSEKQLDFDNWDVAESFITYISSTAKDEGAMLKKDDKDGYYNLKSAMAPYIDPDDDVAGVSQRKIALVALAWECIGNGGKITPKKIELETRTDENGISHMVGPVPLFGGIDVGLIPEEEEHGNEPEPEEKPKRKKNAKKETEPEPEEDELEDVDMDNLHEEPEFPDDEEEEEDEYDPDEEEEEEEYED